MRFEQQPPDIHPALASEPEVRQTEQETFYRQYEIIDQVMDQHRSIPDLARQLGVEEQEARYP